MLIFYNCLYFTSSKQGINALLLHLSVFYLVNTKHECFILPFLHFLCFTWSKQGMNARNRNLFINGVPILYKISVKIKQSLALLKGLKSVTINRWKFSSFNDIWRRYLVGLTNKIIKVSQSHKPHHKQFRRTFYVPLGIRPIFRSYANSRVFLRHTIKSLHIIIRVWDILMLEIIPGIEKMAVQKYWDFGMVGDVAQWLAPQIQFC